MTISRRQFLKGAVSLPLVTLPLSCASPRLGPRPAYTKGLMVLGIDGMDPRLVEKMMAEGRLPNLQAMAKQGGFSRMQTSMPPQSPVAWSNFITGQGPAVHGIYDFVQRDLATMSPALSTSRTLSPSHMLRLGDTVLPLSGGKVELMRRGTPFWDHLTAHGVPAAAIRVPASYPAAEDSQTELLSDLGTPDVMGTYGTFQALSDDPALLAAGVRGGVLHALAFGEHPGGGASIEGPNHPLRATPQSLTLPVDIRPGHDKRAAVVRVGGHELVMAPGEWSPWLPVEFDPAFYVGNIHGMLRLYLKSLTPHVTLYVSPVNIDPLRPDLPISSPPELAEQLAGQMGRFYTQGMAEDTNALESGVFSYGEFVQQASHVLEERLALLDLQLERFRGGFLFFYISTTDLVSHMLWRAFDPLAEGEITEHRETLPGLYASMDALVGQIRARLPQGTDLVVMSDHGFEFCRRNFHVNTWLANRGYLVPRTDGGHGEGPMGYVDWGRTQAYAMGLNQLFVNLKGREPEGIVPEDERERTLRMLARELESYRDPETGERVMTRVEATPPGANAERAPDLVLGYNRGYRCASLSAIGLLGDAEVEANHDKWSGDHCMAPVHVPATLITSRPLRVSDPTLLDLAPTILAHFGVGAPAEMTGRDLFGAAAPTKGEEAKS